MPPETTLGYRLPITGVVAIVGLVGALRKKSRLVVAASLSLLCLLILGKVTIDLLQLQPIDTGLLLLQFVAILFLMEMSLITVQYERDLARLGESADEMSRTVRSHLARWLRSELRADTRLGITSYVLSLGLLVIGGLVSFPIGHLAILAILVLFSVVALLFLLTYRREPETMERKTR